MSRPPKINPEQEPEVIERYKSGETLQALGLHFGCSDTSVGRVLKKNGVPLRPSHRRATLSCDDLRDLVRQYEDGASTTLLASEYGCSSKHVVKLLRRQGISTRKDPKIPLVERERLVRLYRKGASLMTLAKEFGCSARTVTKALREVGMSIREPGNTANPLDPQLAQEILTLNEQGHTQSQIAAHLGISIKVVGTTLRDHGISRASVLGSRHHAWKGGKAGTEDGYVLVHMPADHPFAETMRRSNGYCLEHRLVMAEHLGRALKRHETVHHIDGDKANNEIENLQLRKGKHGKHAAYRCLDCGSENVAAGPL